MKKSLISAIKKLLAKLGAEEVEGNNLVEVIDSGADAIEGGGSGGGSAPFVVKFTGTTAAGNATSNKTYDEIKVAYNSGKQVIFQYQNLGAGLAVYHTDNDRYWQYVCTIVTTNGNKLRPVYIEYNLSDNLRIVQLYADAGIEGGKD